VARISQKISPMENFKQEAKCKKWKYTYLEILPYFLPSVVLQVSYAGAGLHRQCTIQTIVASLS